MKKKILTWLMKPLYSVDNPEEIDWGVTIILLLMVSMVFIAIFALASL